MSLGKIEVGLNKFARAGEKLETALNLAIEVFLICFLQSYSCS